MNVDFCSMSESGWVWILLFPFLLVWLYIGIVGFIFGPAGRGVLDGEALASWKGEPKES